MAEEIEVGSEQEQPIEPERPEWLPEKFKSEEEFVKSYSELERKLTETGQERSAMEAQLGDLYDRLQTIEASQQNNATPGYNPDNDPLLLAYENAMASGDYRAALSIQMGLSQAQNQQAAARQPQAEPQRDYDAWAYVAEQTAINTVGGPQEWEQYKDRVTAEAERENWEGLSAQQAGQKLARLHKMVKADDVLNNQQTAAEQRAEAERQAKLQAQTMAGSSGRPLTPTRDENAINAIKKAAHEGTYESLIKGS